MGELEKAVEQLKSEGYSSEEIQNAIKKIKQEAMEQPWVSGSLDEYLDSLEDENEANPDCELCDGTGTITQSGFDDSDTYIHYGSVTCDCVKEEDDEFL